MEPVEPLRDVLAGLAGQDTPPPEDPQAFLAEHGHADLPGDLLATAIGSYADTAPAEVAEHLSPYLSAHPAGEGDSGLEGLHLLSSAPAGPWDGEVEVDPLHPGEPAAHDGLGDDSLGHDSLGHDSLGHDSYVHGLDVADHLDAGWHDGDSPASEHGAAGGEHDTLHDTLHDTAHPTLEAGNEFGAGHENLGVEPGAGGESGLDAEHHVGDSPLEHVLEESHLGDPPLDETPSHDVDEAHLPDTPMENALEHHVEDVEFDDHPDGPPLHE